MSESEIETASKLIAELRNSKGTYDSFKKKLENTYLIAGKTMAQWKEYFHIEVSNDILPHQIRELELRLVSLYQEATFLKAASEKYCKMFEGLGKASYREAVSALIATYKTEGKRLPAKETIQAIASQGSSDMDDASIHADIELSFWKSILSSLDTCRKLLETTLMALAIEMKAVSNERLADSIIAKQKREQYG